MSKLSCYFCLAEHLLNTCPDLANYIQKGLVIKDLKDGRVKLPNGAVIPGSGPRWKERIDEYWRQRGPPDVKSLFYSEDDEAIDKVSQYQTELKHLQEQVSDMKLSASHNVF
jgi:hypothetical protein